MSDDPWIHRSVEDDDTLHEECGIIGVLGTEEASVVTALGLHALQHRGQEGCGVASFDGERMHAERYLGLVGDHFASVGQGAHLRDRLPGTVAIGHTRYGTHGARVISNVQPLVAELSIGAFAVAHNGNFTNALALREKLVADGAIFQSTVDTEVVLQLVARSRKAKVIDRFVDALKQVEGGYALVCLNEGTIVAARDPIGIRPLVLGWLGPAPVLASETCALAMIGARFEREIENGEVLSITPGSDGRPKVESRFPFPPTSARPCLFEYVYFSRPDSIVGGRSVYEVRKNMGRRLAAETPVEADVVVPVPDSGVAAALGFAEASGIPYDMGIIRSHYIGRTFIQPTQNSRASGVSLKHSANRAAIAGKRVILVDDSIVRGTTSKQIVQLVRDAGAREVHFRSASPQLRFGDYYGIDLPDASTLLAHKFDGDTAAMGRWLGAESLGFLSVAGVYAALGMIRNPAAPQFSDHYFTGEYPTRLVDEERARRDVEPVGSLLAEAG